MNMLGINCTAQMQEQTLPGTQGLYSDLISLFLVVVVVVTTRSSSERPVFVFVRHEGNLVKSFSVPSINLHHVFVIFHINSHSVCSAASTTSDNVVISMCYLKVIDVRAPSLLNIFGGHVAFDISFENKWRCSPIFMGHKLTWCTRKKR